MSANPFGFEGENTGESTGIVRQSEKKCPVCNEPMGFYKNRNHCRRSRRTRKNRLNLVSFSGARLLFERLGCDVSCRVVVRDYRVDTYVGRPPVRCLYPASGA